MGNTLREKRINQIISISVGGAIIAIIVFMIIFNIIAGKRQLDNKKISVGNEKTGENLIEQVNYSIGKSVEESKKNMNTEDEIQIELAVKDNNNANGTSNSKGEDDLDAQTSTDIANTTNEINSMKEDNTVTTNSANEDDSQNANNVQDENIDNSQSKDPTFVMPVEGQIIKHYGKEKLIYSETLKEWTTHLGIDIKADKTTIVKSSADGRVKSIKNDPRYGLTVVVEHQNGFSSVYSNLLTAEFVVVNEEIKAGQTIGTVGNSATFEILDDPHLHFEILKDGNSVDPEMYIKF